MTAAKGRAATFSWPPHHQPKRDSYKWTAGPRPQEMCGQCRVGDHRGHDGTLGCTRTVSREPRDFICACMKGAA